MTTYTTTLNAIRAAEPCKEGWEKLLAHLGKTKADDEPLSLMAILDSNGLDDALWVLSMVMQPEHDRLSRHFQAWCAEQALRFFEAKFPGDTRVRDQIAMLRNDTAAPDERAAARDAAWDAAWDATGDATGAAAWDAAWDAARAAAGEPAGEPAWAAAAAAEGHAAWDAAGAAAWDAARAAEWGAAWDAAREAAWDAAWDAARAAAAAAEGHAAWAATRAAQEQQLRKMLTEGI